MRRPPIRPPGTPLPIRRLNVQALGAALSKPKNLGLELASLLDPPRLLTPIVPANLNFRGL